MGIKHKFIVRGHRTKFRYFIFNNSLDTKLWEEETKIQKKDNIEVKI